MSLAAGKVNIRLPGGRCPPVHEKDGGTAMRKSHLVIGTLSLALILAVSAMFGSGANAVGPTVGLGTATSFAVLAGSAITNTGSSVINGNIGSYPTATTTGFPPGLVNGTNHGGDAVTQGAKTDLVTAYNDAAGRTPVTTLPTELGGTTVMSGFYSSAAGTFGITGNVTLNAQGDPNAVFVFKMASTLTTATGSSVTLINGAQSCNVFWQVGSSATIGGSTTFRGSILALTSITLVTAATVDGRMLARNGAVTLDTNTITVPACSVATATPTATATATPTASPAASAAPTATPAAAPTATPATPVTSLPSTSTDDRTGAIVLGGLLLGAAVLLIIGSRRSIPNR